MLFGDNRDSQRQMYKDALQKAEDGRPMTALETQISDVIKDHPEYREAILPSGGNPGDPLDKDSLPEAGETNPFMHMSWHLAVRDQIATNSPAGIRDVFTRLCESMGDRHKAEHRLCDLMGEELWQSQRDRRPPDEQRYLQRILALVTAK